MTDHCDFQPAEEGIYRCANTGCKNAVRATPGQRIGPAKCQSKIAGQAIERAKEAYPCSHRGEEIGTCKGGGCSVPAWQKRLFACEIHGSCVLKHLSKLPGQVSCDRCNERPNQAP